MGNLDKFCGCLTGGAVGDALGYAVEFLDENQIFSLYGKEGITGYTLKNGIARISDDTQMTLFTAEGLLLAGRKDDSFDYINSIREMYMCWYQTQIEKNPHKNRNLQCRLLNVSELYNRRCPGMTCMSAIREGAKGTIENPINDSKGCGGVMRVAPVGLYFCDTPISYEQSDMIGAEAAALTHGHTLGFIPAAAFVHIVRAVTESNITLAEAIKNSIRAVEKLFPDSEHIFDFTAIMQKAIQLAETDTDDLSAIHQLGEGWVAEETLAIAVYCALKYSDNFDKALRTAVNHNGDSDSTGAVCGNILGAYLGYAAIPQKYKNRLELHDIICKLADKLCCKSNQ